MVINVYHPTILIIKSRGILMFLKYSNAFISHLTRLLSFGFRKSSDVQSPHDMTTSDLDQLSEIIQAEPVAGVEQQQEVFEMFRFFPSQKSFLIYQIKEQLEPANSDIQSTIPDTPKIECEKIAPVPPVTRKVFIKIGIMDFSRSFEFFAFGVFNL